MEESTFFRQINVYNKEATKELISRKFFERDRISHSVEITEILSHTFLTIIP